ncbi:Inosose dehydratase [Planctomycetes bacterium CA13]|uniref:Inosose dehydratase n=1 Tax=Novipirellula herctigrandis TaxID=2527986 RepID=A0A5C5Z962_9BACT|nr:Inosose dehydratase [Planctomycetes bacterium CA13]
MKLTRRESLAAIGTSALLATISNRAFAADPDNPHIATNTYPWYTFSRREGYEQVLHTDELLGEIASTAITGYEPIINNVAEFDGLKERLKNHGLEMRSIYVNSSLHEQDDAEKSIAEVLAIGKAAAKLGTKIVVTNPSPIRWGEPEDKSDTQLRTQAEALDRLGAELRSQGQTLAYHNHDAEMRQGAREFHHMLTATNPENVKFCLDSHWVFRGCGDSEVAVFDSLKRYLDRIVELHLRQSVDGIWTEAFQLDGDIDYTAIFEFINSKIVHPHIVMEQCIEEKTPRTMSAVEAHREGRNRVLAGLQNT